MSLVNLSTIRDYIRDIILDACAKYTFFSDLFPNEKLRGWLNYTLMDQRQTSVQEPDCYHRCEDWAEEVKLLLKGLLSTKSKEVQANNMILWAGKTGCTHINSLQVTEVQREDPETLLKKFKGWTKPKSQ